MKSYNLNPTLKYLKIKIFHFYATLLFLHFPPGNAAGAGLAATLAGALQFQLARAGGAVEAVVQFLAQSTPRQVAVYLSLTLAMTTYHDAAGHMGQIHAVVRLIDFLAAFAATAPTIATCAVFYKCS